MFTGIAIIFAFRLPNPITDWVGIATLSGAAVICGLGSASLALIIQLVVSYLFGLITPLRLIDLSRPDQALLQLLLQKAPGTYQHSLVVANLGEQAADAIGADSLLVRVGALYHDIGKTSNAEFFIENQPPGNINPHSEINPEKSAKIIIDHVNEGVRLGKGRHLPPRIIDFIKEHHGTLITLFQYSKAITNHENNPEKIDREKFRYPGPPPRSKETALIMLADNLEARARADMPKDDAAISDLVHKSIEYCEKEGQLDGTNITIRNLQQIIKSFEHTLKNIYHPRIQYPEIDAKSGITDADPH